MAVYQSKHNKKLQWRIDFTWVNTDGSKERVREWSAATTEQEAQQEEQQLRQQRINAAQNNTGVVVPTLEAYAPTFFAWAADHRKPSTVDDMRKRYAKDLLPKLGGLALDRIDEHVKDSLIASIKKRGVGSSTINNTLGALGSILKHALEAKIIFRRPASRFVSPDNTESSYLTREEYESLVERALEDPRWGISVLIAGDTGLRLGEVRGLQWRDINFEKGWLRVRRALWQQEEDKPKNGQERPIPLRPRLSEALRKHKHKYRWVMCNEVGEPWTADAYDAALERICKRAGVHITWHGLRHTFLSLLCAKGADLRSVQLLAGHAKITTTQRYLHATEEQLKAAVLLLE